jgi:hypothetical protein
MERVKEEEYGSCTLYLYENRAMKPIKIILSKGREGEGE